MKASLFSETHAEGKLLAEQTDRAAHEAFAASRRVGYVPRPLYHDRLNNHTFSDSSPLVIYASSGAGKSALLANWGEEIRQGCPEIFLIEHYVGVGSRHDKIGLMRRVAAEIKEHFNVSQDLPDTPEELTRSFAEWLWYARQKPEQERQPTLLLILDGLNQLPEEGEDLAWLPEEMPPGVRLVLSTTSDAMLRKLRDRSWQVMEVAPLTATERRKVVGAFIRDHHPMTGEKEMGKLADDHSSGNPLLLRIRLEEVGRQSRGGETNRQIADILKAESLDDVYAHMLARAETEHGEETIRELFSFLALAHNELLISELETLCNERRGIPELFQRMSFHVTLQNGTLRFHHSSLRNASLERYLKLPEDVEEIRDRLATFFAALPPSQRTASEAAHHFHELSRWNDLAAFLTRLGVQQALWNDVSRYDYMIYWRATEQHIDIASICVTQVESEAEKMSSDVESTQAMIRTGSILQITGHISSALKFFTSALDYTRQTGEPALVAEAYKHCGTVNRQLGNQEEARKYFLQGVEKAEESGDRSLWATIMGNLGNLELSRGNYREAIRLQKINLQEAEKNNDTQEIARIYGNLGSSYLELREYDKAEYFFQKMLELAEATNNARRTAMALGSMGILYSRQGNFPAALEKYQEQERIAELIGDKEQLAGAIGNRGIIYSNKREYHKALSAYYRMEKISALIHNPRFMAVACDGIGRVMIEQHSFDQATEYLQRAYIQHKRLENTRGCLAIRLRFGEVEMKRKNYDRALDYFETVIRIAQQIGNQYLLAEALYKTGEALFSLGQLVEAEEKFQETLTLGGSLNRRYELAGLTGLGIVSLEQGNIPQAVSLFEKGLEIVKEDGVQDESETLLCKSLYAAIKHSVSIEGEAIGNWENHLDRLLQLCSQHSVPPITQSVLQLFDQWRQNSLTSITQIGTLLASIHDPEERADTVDILLLLATATASPLLPQLQATAEKLIKEMTMSTLTS